MEKELLKLEQGDLLCTGENCLDEEFKGVSFTLVCPTDTPDENRTRIPVSYTHLTLPTMAVV